MKYSDIKWVQGFWDTPDGKKIPYERTDVVSEFSELKPDPWGIQDAPFFEVQITRWPRKVTVVAIANEGCDGYTQDGDGDGVTFDVVARTIFPLVTTDRYVFQRDFEKIMADIAPMLKKVRNKIDHQYDY